MKQHVVRYLLCVTAAGLLTGSAIAQYGGGGTGGGTTGGGTTGGGTTGGGTTGGGTSGGTTGGTSGGTSYGGTYNFNGNYHLGFERPEAWGLKYFISTSLLSGLPPAPTESHRTGSITIGFETAWIPNLDAGQTLIGYNGRVPEDLNKAPVFMRPIVRIGLPGKFSALFAAPPPFHVFGVTPHLAAFGLERPLYESPGFTLGWRGYGQLGSVKGAFTCPSSALAFAPGSPGNPTECVGKSADVARLRYAGMEFQISHRLAGMPKVVPHAAAGGTFVDGVFQVHAPVEDGMDNTRLWTRGGIFSTSGGVTYLVTKQAAFTVDAFYSPLWVQRSRTGPRTNDGLFNVRALVSYTFR